MPRTPAPSRKSGTTPSFEDWGTRLERLLKANPKLTTEEMGVARDHWEEEWRASLPPPLSNDRDWED